MCNSNSQLHCKLNVPRSSIRKPLIQGSYGTNVSGECAPCQQFFGKELKKPPVTKLANIVMHGHNPNKVKQLEGNPDNQQSLLTVGSVRTSTRRRRRTALIQEHFRRGHSKEKHKNSKTAKKNQKDKTNLKMVGDFLNDMDLQGNDDGNPSFLKVLNDVKPLPAADGCH